MTPESDYDDGYDEDDDEAVEAREYTHADFVADMAEAARPIDTWPAEAQLAWSMVVSQHVDGHDMPAPLMSKAVEALGRWLEAWQPPKEEGA